MDLFALDRELFGRLLSKGTVRDGDYYWTTYDRFDEDSTARVYLRLHVSGNRTYWVIREYDAERAVMQAVRLTTVVVQKWTYV